MGKDNSAFDKSNVTSSSKDAIELARVGKKEVLKVSKKALLKTRGFLSSQLTLIYSLSQAKIRLDKHRRVRL